MGYGNKSVSGVHPILKHMNKLGGNPEIKYDPIKHDEKGMGRGGKLGTAQYKEEKGMPAYGDKIKYFKKGDRNGINATYDTDSNTTTYVDTSKNTVVNPGKPNRSFTKQ